VPGPIRPGRRGHRRAVAHLHKAGVGQIRQRQRQRGEVVDGHQRVEIERAAHGLDRERPVVVGQLDLVTSDRIGQADGRMARPGRAATRQHVEPHRGFERGVLGHLVCGDLADAHRRVSMAKRTLVPPTSARIRG
jgi:hypothetical protein